MKWETTERDDFGSTECIAVGRRHGSEYRIYRIGGSGTWGLEIDAEDVPATFQGCPDVKAVADCIEANRCR